MLNAVLIKDFRTYSRNKAYFYVFMFYVFVLCAVFFGMLWFSDTSKKPLNPEYGQNIFFVLIILVSSAICSICPALAVNIISSEKNDIQLLKPTLLKNYQIILSKLIIIIAYILTLILLSIPVMILVTPISGFSLRTLFECYLIIFISAFAFSIMGIIWSSVLSRITALSLTYVSVITLSIGTVLIPIIMSKILKLKLSYDVTVALYGLSPFWILSKKISESSLPDKIFSISLGFYHILIYFLIVVITVALTFIFVKRW